MSWNTTSDDDGEAGRVLRCEGTSSPAGHTNLSTHTLCAWGNKHVAVRARLEPALRQQLRHIAGCTTESAMSETLHNFRADSLDTRERKPHVSSRRCGSSCATLQAHSTAAAVLASTASGAASTLEHNSANMRRHPGVFTLSSTASAIPHILMKCGQ